MTTYATWHEAGRHRTKPALKLVLDWYVVSLATTDRLRRGNGEVGDVADKSTGTSRLCRRLVADVTSRGSQHNGIWVLRPLI